MNNRKSEIRKHLQTNENENITYQNTWDAVKAKLIKKFIALNAYIKKDEKDFLFLVPHVKYFEIITLIFTRKS